MLSKGTLFTATVAVAAVGITTTEAGVTLKNHQEYLQREIAKEATNLQDREFHLLNKNGQGDNKEPVETFMPFEEYVSKFKGKEHIASKEFAERKRIYEENLKTVEALNSHPEDDAFYTVHNMFGDVDTKTLVPPVVFDQSGKSNNGAAAANGHELEPLETKGLPETFDWRDHGAVTEVRNQGSAGSCWSFSAAEATEGVQFLKNGKLEKLSPEFLVECDPRDCGVYGGLPSNAYEFVMAEGGFVKEASVPYCAGGGTYACTPCMAPHYNQTLCGKVKTQFCNKDRNVCDIEKMHPDSIGAKIVDWKQLVTDEEQIKAALVKYGPLSVALNAQWLQFYAWGISNPVYCPPVLDHAVLLVGYGVELGYYTGRQKPYWILKNSWSDTWGEKGYFRLGRGYGACGVNTAVTFPVVE